MAILLAVGAIAFGALMEERGAFAARRKTDAGVFFRAGYAVRAGTDPYRITDDNEWYFLYPPGIAPFFVPFADPPPAAKAEAGSAVPPASGPRGGVFLPYPVSLAIWYVLGVGCAILSVELLARTLIGGSADPRVRALTPSLGGWWNIRFWPLLIALPDILSTLSRGQVNLAVLACICAGVLLLSRGRRFRGGFLLAAGACIKVIPGLLVFDVLTRRGTRAMVGYAACGLTMMVAVPVAVYGPTRAYEYTREWTDRVLLSGLRGDEGRLQAGADFADTDNLSIQGALHNLTNIATPRGQRPGDAAPWVKVTHVIVSLGLLAATLLVGRKPWAGPGREDTALEITLRIGMLCCVMVLAAPMCHRHYYVLLLPGLFGLVFVNLMRSRLAVPIGWGIVLIPAYIIAQTIPRATQEGPLRDLPIPLAANLCVWALCAIVLVRLAQRGGAPAPVAAKP